MQAAFARSSGGQGDLKLPSRRHLSSAPNQIRGRRPTKLGAESCHIIGHPPNQAHHASGSRQGPARSVLENPESGSLGHVGQHAPTRRRPARRNSWAENAWRKDPNTLSPQAPRSHSFAFHTRRPPCLRRPKRARLGTSGVDCPPAPARPARLLSGECLEEGPR